MRVSVCRSVGLYFCACICLYRNQNIEYTCSQRPQVSNEAVHIFFHDYVYGFSFYLRPQLVLVGLVALAAAQEEEFLVIDDEVEKNDIDPDSLEKLESDGTVKGVLKELLSQDR